jgi:hypothetical protein
MNPLTLFRLVYAAVIAIVSLQTVLGSSAVPVQLLGAVETIAAIAFAIAPFRLAGFALIACYTVAIGLHAMSGQVAVRLVADIATVLFLLFESHSIRGATFR